MNKQYTIGIGGILGHDANIAIFSNDQLLYSAQEERFSRIKHDAKFPVQALREGLDYAGIEASQVDVIIFAEKPIQSYLYNKSKRPSNALSKFVGKVLPERIFPKNSYITEARYLFPSTKFLFAWHHLSHAAGAFYTSPFSDSAFLCVDGKGEDGNASIGVVDNEQIKILYELDYANGLGMLYTFITHFLGFPSFGSEYKIMGLAPYGNPVYKDQLSALFTSSSYGELKLKKDVGFNPTTETKNHFDWAEEVLNMSYRKKSDPLIKEHVDLAASLQSLFEDELIKMAKFAKEKTRKSNLLFCGGCAQNCVAAGKLRDSKIFEQVFNSPVGGDMGSGLGAALLYLKSRNLLKNNKINDKGFYIGPLPGQLKSPEAPAYKIDISVELHSFVADLLAKGYIIGWVRNGMELGARALGARSILANPLDPEMQTKLNLKIKFRESFRPFAPAILEEYQDQWFDTTYPSHFMQYTAYLKPELRYDIPKKFDSFREQLNYPRCKVPSIVHVDFSARLQTVSKKIHPDFHKLISAFNELTGIPMLINTSFNVNGQPIVRTADEAWECFINTEIDYLVVNDEIYKNPFQRTKEQKLQWLKQFEDYSR